MEEEQLRELSVHAAELLSGKTVAKLDYRREGRELFIEFDDGTRLFVHAQVKLDVSITGGADD